jgi:hypothetical protein
MMDNAVGESHTMYTCRECETEINQGTEVCPHCGTDLTFLPEADAVEAKKPTLLKVLLRWGMLLGVLLGAMWSFVWFVVTPRTGQVAVQAETRAVQALDQVQSALRDYSAAVGGTYPPSLEVLGPPARQAAQMAQSEGYSLNYAPGQAGLDGASHSYSLHARASSYGYRNFYTDSTGVVRATNENRDASPSDPPIR